MSKFWTNGKGESILIEKMTDSYLINCIKFLERKAKEIVEIQEEYFEEDYLDDTCHADLVEEAKKRGLSWDE